MTGSKPVKRFAARYGANLLVAEVVALCVLSAVVGILGGPLPFRKTLIALAVVAVFLVPLALTTGYAGLSHIFDRRPWSWCAPGLTVGFSIPVPIAVYWAILVAGGEGLP